MEYDHVTGKPRIAYFRNFGIPLKVFLSGFPEIQENTVPFVITGNFRIFYQIESALGVGTYGWGEKRKVDRLRLCCSPCLVLRSGKGVVGDWEKKKNDFFFLIRCCPSVAPSSSVLRTSIFATEFKLEVEEYCLHFLNMFFQTPKFAFLRAETK